MSEGTVIQRGEGTPAGKLELARAAIDAHNAADIERLLELFHPEVVIPGGRSFSREREYVGHEGLRRWMAEERDRYRTFRVVPHEVRAVGEDRVLVFGVIEVQRRESGGEAGAFVALLYTFEGNAIRRVETFRDSHAALAAAGLLER